MQRKSIQVETMSLVKKPAGEVSKNQSILKSRPNNSMIEQPLENQTLVKSKSIKSGLVKPPSNIKEKTKLVLQTARGERIVNKHQLSSLIESEEEDEGEKTSNFQNFKNAFQVKVPNKKESRNTVHNTQLSLNKTNNFGLTKSELKVDQDDNLNQTTIHELKADERIVKQSFGLK